MKMRALFLLAAALGAGCATATATPSGGSGESNYERGRALFERKNFRGAVEAFEKAHKAEPDDSDVTEALATARKGLAADLVNQARNRPVDNVWAQFDDLDEALSLDPANASAQAAFADLWREENSLQQNLNRVYAELNGGRVSRAYDLFKPLARFIQYRSEFKKTEELLLSELKHDTVNQALAELAAGRAADARRHLDDALQLDPEDARAKAGLLALGGSDQLGKKDYRAALATFRQALELFPAFTFAQKNASMSRRGVVSGILSDQLTAYQRAKDPGAVVKTLSAHQEALALAQPEDPERAEVNARLVALNGRLVSSYLNTAVRAANLGPQYAATVLAALRAAHLLDPEVTQRYEPLASRALKAVQDRTRLNVALHFQAGDREADQLASFLHESSVAALDKSGLSGINVVTREHLKDLVIDEESLGQGYSSKQGKGLDLATADVILLGNVVRNRVTETGRNHPNKKGSKFISGTKDVRNPAFGEAQAAVHDAQIKLQQAQANYEQRKSSGSSTSSALGAVFGDMGKLAGAALSAGTTLSDTDVQAARKELAEAQTRFDSTSPTVEENVVKTYFYKEYNVTVEADLRVSLKLIDRRTSLQQKAEVIAATLNKSGFSREDVEYTDQNGLKNVEGPLPDPDETRNQAQEELHNKLMIRVVELIQQFRRQRIDQQSKVARTEGKSDDEVENAALYLTMAPPDDPRVNELEAVTVKAAGLSYSNRLIEPFKSSKAGTDPWPVVAIE